jgi:hypothetical protein
VQHILMLLALVVRLEQALLALGQLRVRLE